MPKELKTHSIRVEKTAQYFSLGTLGEHTKLVYIALHGYGQRANRFIQKFADMGEEVFVLAPEGLSYFYWQGLDGPVVASWMTKEQREEEIANYCDYLDRLYQEFLPQIPAQAELRVLGFSQGGTTALNWLLRKEPQGVQKLILWASSLPPYLLDSYKKGYLQARSLDIVYGNADEFISEKTLAAMQQLLQEAQLEPRIECFEGKHRLDVPTLMRLYAR